MNKFLTKSATLINFTYFFAQIISLIIRFHLITVLHFDCHLVCNKQSIDKMKYFSVIVILG